MSMTLSDRQKGAAPVRARTFLLPEPQGGACAVAADARPRLGRARPNFAHRVERRR